MSQQKKNRSEPSPAATPAPIITSTPNVPPAASVTTSPQSESLAAPTPPAKIPAMDLGLKPGPTLPALKRPAAQAPVKSTEEQNGESFIILIKSPRGTLHALMNPKAGQGAIAVFHTAEAAAAVLTSNPVCLNNKSCIIEVEGL